MTNELKFENVKNFFLNGSKKSSCEMYWYNGDSWVYDGVITCDGFYKKAETIYKKWCENDNKHWSV
jgi:hypothetical protein